MIDRDAAGGDEAVSFLKRIERAAEVEPGLIRQPPQLFRRFVRVARNRQESFQHFPLVRVDRLARPQRGLLEEPVGDFARAASTGGVDAGNRQQILDERLGAGVVGALHRRQHARLGQRALAMSSENGR